MKRYTLLLYILATAAFLLSASCNRKDARPLPEELVRAGRLVWDTPDSALYVLQSMPVPSESQRLARATWALLTAQARPARGRPAESLCLSVQGRHQPRTPEGGRGAAVLPIGGGGGGADG